MTKEEAIKRIQQDLDVNGKYLSKEYKEALNMAISALKGEKDGRIRYKLSKPIEYIELVYTDKEVTQLSYEPNITLVTPKADRPTDDDIKDRQIKQLAHDVVILEKQLADRPTIVRCKDCEYKSDWNGVYNHDTELFCYLHECGMDNNDFCSRAKMKGGNE